MRLGALVVIAIAATASMSACDSTTPTVPGGSNSNAAGGAASLASADICKSFTAAEAKAILGTDVKPQDRNDASHCGYEAVLPADQIAGASISVTVRVATTSSTLASRAATLHLTTKVDGVGDEAYSDGKLTLLAVKKGIEIQAVFVNIGAATSADPLDSMKRAASDVANGL